MITFDSNINLSMEIIVSLCLLLLFAYIFDLSASKTKIPSVILLLLLGWGVHQIILIFNIKVIDLSSMLPILGTVGLILIVLEGSLELELNKSKAHLIKQSFWAALIPMVLISFLVASMLILIKGVEFQSALASTIPIAIISSAIAIPSVKYLSTANKEFVVYESSFSDILGVVFFNFVIQNEIIEFSSIYNLLFQILIVLLISIAAIVFLSVLIKKIDHHIKYSPIIIIIILVYFVTKHYHLPALIFIMLFGLFLGNFDEIKKLKWMRKFSHSDLQEETSKFQEMVVEGAFLIRSVFFILFGFLIETSDLLNVDSLIWAIGIVLLIFLVRIIYLKIVKLPIVPLAYIAPRGLITILLFLSLPIEFTNSFINKALIIQIILISAFIMMLGLIFNKEKPTMEIHEP